MAAKKNQKTASPLIMSNMVVRCPDHVLVKQVFLHATKQLVAAASTYRATKSIYSGRGAAPVLLTGLQQHAFPGV